MTDCGWLAGWRMGRWVAGPMCLALLLVLPFGGAAQELAPQPQLLVDAAWVRAHGEDPRLRLVDLRSGWRYLLGHMPGAVHLSTDVLHTTVDGVDGMLAPLAEVQAALREAGISADSIVVAYDDRDGLSASRLFWALEYLGHADVRLLDGGWDGWRDAGGASTTATPDVAPGNFVARPRDDLVAPLAWLRDHLADSGVQPLDTRTLAEFTGERRYSDRGGRIPGAVWVHWREHFDPQRPGYLRDPGQLLARYQARGVSPQQEQVVYCQVMARASHTYFVLRWLGYPRVRGYDGSWEEWGNRADTPVQRGPPE